MSNLKLISMKTTITKLAIGIGGIASSEIATSINALDPSQITEVGSILVQIIIAVVTLFGLFKKKPKV